MSYLESWARVCAGSKIQTLTPASAHTHAAVPTTMVCKKTQAAANTTKGWISLEQATAQGCWSSPGCFPQHNLLPGRLITQITFKASAQSSFLASCPAYIPSHTIPVQGPRQPLQHLGHSSCLLQLSRTRRAAGLGPSAERTGNEFGRSKERLRQLQSSTSISKS